MVELLAVALVIGAVLISLIGYFAVRRLINNHTELLKSQAQIVTEVKQELRAELHQKASVSFEKAVEQNVEYITKDLRQASEALSNYVRAQFDSALRHEMRDFRDSSEGIGKVSRDALLKLEQAIAVEQTAIINSFQEEQKAILEDLRKQHATLTKNIEDIVTEETNRRIQHFQTDMARIVTSYVNDALAGSLDIDAQMAYIIDALEQNKQAIVEDISHVA